MMKWFNVVMIYADPHLDTGACYAFRTSAYDGYEQIAKVILLAREGADIYVGEELELGGEDLLAVKVTQELRRLAAECVSRAQQEALRRRYARGSVSPVGGE